MAKKDLKYFMRSMEPEIVTVPGPESIKDENGEVIQFEIKKLTQEEITRINDAYRKHSIATDKRGNPLVSNGEVIWKTERDGVKGHQTPHCRGVTVPEPERPGFDEILRVRGHYGNAAQGVQPG